MSSSTKLSAAASIPPVANGRAPKRSDRYPDVGPEISSPIVSGSMNRPARSGVWVKSTPCSGSQIPWSQMINMNSSPPRATAARNDEIVPNENARIRISESLNIGSVARRSISTNATSDATPAASSTITRGLVHPVVELSVGP